MLRRKVAPYSRRKYRGPLRWWLFVNWLPLAIGASFFFVGAAAMPLFVHG